MSNLITIREADSLADFFGDPEFPELDPVLRLLSILNISKYHIAGGYFRDKLLGVTPKDVDVFLPGSEDIELLHGEKIRYDLEGAMEVEAEGVRVNFVRLHSNMTFAQVLERMDIGLCQVGWLEGAVMATPEFVKDRDSKTITVLYPVTTEGDHDHVKRVIAKYPDYKVIFE